MLKLCLILQLVAGDTNYSSPALRQFIAEAALANREPPPGLHGYSARLETDLALLLGDSRGEEHAGQLEQVASTLDWRRSGQLQQHVVGYRARGAVWSTLSRLPQPWIIPTLYGDRLRLVFVRPRDPGRPPSRRPLIAVHPLAEDRDSVYHFAGGDTIVQMQLNGRRLDVVRVQVTPHARAQTRLLVFRGELYLDAARRQLVRMRGELAVLGSNPSLLTRALSATLRGFVFLDIVEAEFQENFWLPTWQRLDLQVRSPMAGDFQPVFRIVTRFHQHVVDTTGTSLPTDSLTAADTSWLTRAVGRLSFAPADSMNDFSQWLSEIGVEASAIHARDFDDLAAQPWHSAGLLQYRVAPERFSHVFRFNRVEGFYTGVPLHLRLAPELLDLSLAGHAGYAWAEETVRGGVALRYRRSPWSMEAAATRELAHTNDFVPPLEGVATFGALFGSIDDFDYVDRKAATLSLTRALNQRANHLLRLEFGPARDEAVSTHRRRGLFVFDSQFRPVRPVVEGSYLREFAALEINPGVSGLYFEPGVGLTLSYERGHGEMDWQRVDGVLTARRFLGSVTVGGRMDLTAVFGGSPPQRLPEFGANEGLPGYDYKEFGGDRAALLRLGLGYTLPFGRNVWRIGRRFVMPGPAPTLSAGLQSGWAAVREPGTLDALAAFGTRPDPDRPGALLPLTRPTDGVRSSVAFSLDLFGGVIGVGVARPIDRAAPWKLFIGSAQLW